MVRGGSEGLHECVVFRVVSAALRNLSLHAATGATSFFRLLLEVVRRFSKSKKISKVNLHLATMCFLRLSLAATIML